MNSRSSVNESNLVNLSADLSTLNPLDTKESLSLSFPFDHIYACHSDSPDRRSLQLDKEVEITTFITTDKDPVVSGAPSLEVSRLSERLSKAETQNKKLKDLLIYHLDLIQQQNDLISKREKLFVALKQENDTLKTKVNRLDKRVTISHRHIPPPVVHVPHTPVTSTVVKNETITSPSHIAFNTLTELLLPDKLANAYIFKSDAPTKPIKKGTISVKDFAIEKDPHDGYVPADSPTIIESSGLHCDYTMIENKRSYLKKDLKSDPRPDPLYTVTSNSGTPIIHKIQRNRRRNNSGMATLTRITKGPPVRLPESAEALKLFEEDQPFQPRPFSVNKKTKMINTYSKSRIATITKRPPLFTGSLSDRLKLIDTTPTGEDPYQLGEADMREQSPIPKLMLQKNNHGRLKICTDTGDTTPSRRIYDAPVTETNNKMPNKIKLEKIYDPPSTITQPQPVEIKKEVPDSPPPPPPPKTKTLIVEEPDLDMVKTETEIDWRCYPSVNQTSLCDFSYGETSNNFSSDLSSQILQPLEAVEFQQLVFVNDQGEDPYSLSDFNNDVCLEKVPIDKIKRRANRTTSLIAPHGIGDLSAENKRGCESKRGRKRALSTTGLSKSPKQNLPKPVGPKPKMVRGKAACRGKKSPVPGMMTRKPYHTLVGDPDLSWYLGLDPDVKLEDVDQAGDCKASTVEVPRWREKPYTSCYSLEGTENLDDKVFEKRHQKLEAEERRQLRWHMRRIREQRHVERLRQRQRDPWGNGNGSTYQFPSVFTIWPQPQRDVKLIEITDTLPVMAFGEALPELPPADFMLPWVRTSKALKRSKRSKTLH